MTADSQAVPQCAVPAVPDGSQPGPLDWPAGAHARRIGDTLERLNPRWAEVMDGRRSPWEQWVREQVCPRQTPAEAGERDHAGIWPQPVPRGRHAAPVTEPVPPMTRPYRIPEAAVVCDECNYDDHQCSREPAEEVMPHGSARDAQGRTRQLETAPRPGQEAEGISLPSITGPGRAESLDEYLASPGYQAALAAADAESWDQPGVSVEDMIAAADERRAEAKARRDAEKFGAPRDEQFWGDDKPQIVPPPETAEMTAITERPGQEQQ